MFTPGVPKSPKLAFVQLCRFVTIRRIGQKSKAFQEVAHGVIAQLGKIGIAIFTYFVLILRGHSRCMATSLLVLNKLGNRVKSLCSIGLESLRTEPSCPSLK